MMLKINQYFQNLPIGTEIPGVISRKKYRFHGMDKYKGKGNYSGLTGEQIIRIKSMERRRNIITLFIQPLVILYKSKPDALSYGALPNEYVRLKHENSKPLYPNLQEYYTHYKAVALFLKSKLNN